MPTYRDSAPIRRTHSELVQAVRADEDLPDEEWERLWQLATPQQRRIARLIIDPDAAPHGDPATYTNWGCRCAECGAAYSGSRRTGRAAADFTPAPAAPAPAAPTQAQPGETMRDKVLRAHRAGFAVKPEHQHYIDELEGDGSDVI